MGESVKESVTDILCGSIAGMAGKLIEYPFDTVKVRLQTQSDLKPLQFRGPLDCFRQTFHNEGLFGFYRGLSPPLIGAMAENATLFFAYNRAQEFFKSSNLFVSPSNPDALSITGLVAAGGISGACTSYVLTPIELVKCKLQVQNVGQYTPGTTTFPASSSSASSALKRMPLPATTASLHTSTKIAQPGPLQLALQIYRVQGISGFWRGQMGTFLRESGGSAAWFGTYEYVSSFLKSRRQSTTAVPAQDLMFSGACAGMAYNLVLFPADSIKSRMQTDAISDVRGSRGRGFWEVGKEMWRYGGIRVFYRGCLITVLRAAPSSAVIFWTYENLKKIAQ